MCTHAYSGSFITSFITELGPYKRWPHFSDPLFCLNIIIISLPLESFNVSIACGGSTPGPLQITLTSTTSEPLLENVVS